jgi:hypothetical protein
MPVGRFVKSKYPSLARFFSPKSLAIHPWRSETQTCYVRESACEHPEATTSLLTPTEVNANNIAISQRLTE